MNLDLTPKETAALAELARQKDMSEAAVMRQALRLYQLVHERMKAGESFSFSGDAARAAEFAGLASIDDCHACRGTGRYGGVYGPRGQPICDECKGTGKAPQQTR